MNKAIFFLHNYTFEKINIDYSKSKSDDIEILFSPKGIYKSSNSEFELNIVFEAKCNGFSENFVEISCIAHFKFNEETTYEDIPDYFYANSIAIIFPYIRAFVSTVTLQANMEPMVLPTLNLTALEKPLKENTIQI